MEQIPPGKSMLYTFFRATPAWMALPKDQKERAIGEYLDTVERFKEKVIVRPYSTVGLKRDTDYVLWMVASEYDQVQELSEALRHTTMARYLENPYAYMAVTRESTYVKAHPEEDPKPAVAPGQSKYLFVYPFVKSREWYLLPMEKRRAMMAEHIKAGHRFPNIRINTGYSFGLDDQEFVVAFEGEDPKEFVALTMLLRESEASRYTVRDTPQYTCARKPLRDILWSLG